jgi:hypothetical protein
MAKEKLTGISKGLKALFVVHGVSALVAGFMYLVMPFKWAELSKYGPIDQVFMRLFGAITLALSFKDWMCLYAKAWAEVRIIVMMEVVWTLLATLLGLYLAMFAVITAPVSLIWLNTVIFAAFFIAWTYFYIKYRR